MQAYHRFHHTETFATPIVDLIPPQSGSIIRLTSWVYTAAGTVHDLLFMRALNQVETTAAAAAAATTIVLDSATFCGQTIAANDYVVTENADGTHTSHLVSALATLTITVPSLAKAINSGAKVWIMGAPADTSYHSTLKSIASTRLELVDYLSGIAQGGFDDGTSYARTGTGDPVLLYSANGTAAGILNRASARYVGS